MDLLRGTFPDGFMWATATAAYQIEGAWDADGKGESIWDRFCHEPGHVLNGDTGDIACDSYHKYEEDIQLIKNMGCTHYRFSISWPRVLPEGTPEKVNQTGVTYYNKLIDGLLAAGIQPLVTLFHWDFPQALQDKGGWTDERSITWFADYAQFCYEKFGDRVKWWLTVNEPAVLALMSYGQTSFAPGAGDPYESLFVVLRNYLQAHVRAYRVYDKLFRQVQKGNVGISLQFDGAMPLNPDSATDLEAAETYMKVMPGLYLDPLLGDGDFPEVLLKRSAKIAEVLGLNESPLKGFNSEEKADNKGACDFIGVNNYTSRKATMGTIGKPLTGSFGLPEIFGIDQHVDASWKRAGVEWLYETPWGMRRLLNWVKSNYGDIPMFITENGTTDGETSEMNDVHRIHYLTSYINEVLKAIKLDGCHVIGYTVWSLMDNFEWDLGYSQNFGLHSVDFKDPQRKRTPKASVQFYKDLIKSNGFPE